MHTVQLVIDFIFLISLFINAALFIPQIICLLRQKNSKDVSLITFGGFCIMQLAAILYGVIHHDWEMIVGYGISLFACGIVTCLVIYYRIKN